MKKTILFLGFLMALLQPLAAQDTGFQSFFGHETTVWHGEIGYFDYAWGGLLQMGGDTVIEGIQYKKIEYSDCKLFNGVYREYRDPEHDFYLREDTLTGKLWCRFPDWCYEEEDFWYWEESYPEVLIADMSLTIGDTFVVYPPVGQGQYRVIYNVVDTTTENHSHIVVLQSPFNEPTIKFIEGVGCTNLFDYGIFVSIGSIVRCCHKDNELIYHWQSQEDDGNCVPSFVGIEECEDRHTVSVYPNPCTDKVWIDGEDIQSASLLDIRGKVLLSTIDTHHPLDISSLPQGVYLLRILTPAGPTTKKLLVQ